MKLTFLGTGAGVPSRQRNVAGLALTMGNGSVWLFDAGEGTQLQVMKTAVKLSRISRIFITHLHGDHVFGLPGLLSTRSFQAGASPVHVYGPKGIKEYLETALRLTATHLSYPLEIHQVSDGTVIRARRFTVTARLVDHVIPSFGYRIVEDEHPGELQVDRLRELGLGPGPAYAVLKAGGKVTRPGGQVIHGHDYLGPRRPGTIITIVGDTRACDATVDLARDADVFVHESTYAQEETDLANQYGHSTCVQVAKLAKQAGAKRLLLTHISARYAVPEVLQSQARAVFPAADLMGDLYEVEI